MCLYIVLVRNIAEVPEFVYDVNHDFQTVAAEWKLPPDSTHPGLSPSLHRMLSDIAKAIIRLWNFRVSPFQ